MRQFLDRCLCKLDLHRYRRKIDRALALCERGDIRKDGLTAVHVRGCLEIRWRARDVHPWDRDCVPNEKEVIFAEQALADTEAAVYRLFERLPEIDVIELRVLEPNSEALIATGTVNRSALHEPRSRTLSAGMRLENWE